MAERPGGRIAIVGLTAGSSEESLAACLDAGMDAVTTKPVTLARLRSAIADGRTASGHRTVANGQETRTPRLRELAEVAAMQADLDAALARFSPRDLSHADGASRRYTSTVTS